MTNPAIRLATLAMFSMALAVAPPLVPAFAAGGGGDRPSLVDAAAREHQADEGARHPHHPEGQEKGQAIQSSTIPLL